MLKRLLEGTGGRDRKDVERRLHRLEQRQRDLQRFLLNAAFGLGPRRAAAFDPRGVGFLSQHGEDGWLIHLFTEIGAPRRTFLEIGVQDGLECNSACFALHFGWGGVMVEGDPECAAAARRNLAAASGVTVREAFVTRENIEGLLDEAGVDRDCDLFSLDIDGNDYWIWDTLEDFNPRVVVVEYNGYFGVERAVTIPYVAGFRHRAKHPRYYMGASLLAYQRLAARRGYELVGACEGNAFFVRRDALSGSVRVVPVEEAYTPPEASPRTERIMAKLRGLPLVEVE